MQLTEFLDYLNNGYEVSAGSDIHKYMTMLSQEAIKITTEINNVHHTPEEIGELFSKLIGKPLTHFSLFPPFTTDCGKNISLGDGVFINSGCRFQDQGGITIKDKALIGHNVIITTLNHNFNPEKRGNLLPSPVVIGSHAWIGSGSIILPGVTIGDNAVIGAGSVVTKNIPENMIAVGNPARVIKSVFDE